MLQYVNSFTCTKNEKSDTVVVHFIQNEPVINETEDGLDTIIKENEIASIVMEGPCAKGLIKSLTELFEDECSDDVNS